MENKKLFIKTLTGKTVSINYNIYSSIEEVKALI